MNYTGTMQIPQHLANEMERICQQADSSVKSKGTEFDQEHTFEDGVRMAIQVCPSGTPEEPCWTQGVLFAADGNELGCTEVKENFLGDYTVEDEGDTYTVTVVAQTEA